MNDKTLMDMAHKAREMAYAPYSRFTVGAALLAENGKIYLGCNIENGAYSPTNCAERTAFFKAISEGERRFTAIAVCGGNADAEAGFCPPCGVCRQVMAEFCDPDTFAVIVPHQDATKRFLLKELLPFSFSL